MLQINNICKEYHTTGFTQKALDNVGLNLRNNEFVAILGPSGSGKTTLLNIIGGLDRYDSGDLVINGVSTKKYKDRDWDAYRNHTIGFVFQSYNLIPHQTILSNVELALTISGISREERQKRAAEALKKVGLGDQLHKKPNQLSGGQMQRVAIARALVNDPDILLADEPTGALDTATSIQVMDLLKEVASDRLVVMVTHNPELADRYATRIVSLRDGRIVSDSDPFHPGADPDEASHASMGKASMSFLTALSLSFNNLLTKKARTFLVAFAGSIGIIGIALILSLSNGVNGYIDSIEEETLSQYPVQVQKTSFNFSALMNNDGASGAPSAQKKTTTADSRSGKVHEFQTVTSMFSQMDSNDLKSLKKYLDSGKSGIHKYAKSIEYHYGITPQIYRKTGKKSYRQVNPNDTFASLGIGSGLRTPAATSGLFSTDTFFALPEDQDLYQKQYTIKAGHWPSSYNEVVVVLTGGNQISDMALYTLGLKDEKELDRAVKQYASGGKIKFQSKLSDYNYKDLLNVRFRLVNNADQYRYSEKYKIWTNMSDDADYMNNLAAEGDTLRVAGIAAPKENTDITMLQSGIGYSPALREHITEEASDSLIVQDQRKNPKINVFTGKKFNAGAKGIDLTKLFDVNPAKLQNAFKFNPALLNPSINPTKFDTSGISALQSMNRKDAAKLLGSAASGMTQKNMKELFQSLLQGYQRSGSRSDLTSLTTDFQSYLQSDAAQSVIRNALQKQLSAISRSTITQADVQSLVQSVMSGFGDYLQKNDLRDPSKTSEYLKQYLQSPEAQTAMQSGLAKILDGISGVSISQNDIQKIMNALLSGYSSYAKKHRLTTPEMVTNGFMTYLRSSDAQKRLSSGIQKMIDLDSISTGLSQQIRRNIQAQMSGAMSQLTSSMGNMLSVNPAAFADAIKVNMSEQQLQALLSQQMSSGTASYEDNLRQMGYADTDNPYEITIYPKNFEAKSSITGIIDHYNSRMKKTGHKDRIIAYTDLVGTMMSSVTKIINAISYVLIAFVSISLIVSSIMIGVITYISVLERRKEIGILRAIGASKHNISNVFNAETFIIGALAGLMGVVISWILLIPGNMIIAKVTEGANIHASLPISAALILTLLSIGLTLLGGLIPSRKAAKSDPVSALRSE